MSLIEDEETARVVAAYFRQVLDPYELALEALTPQGLKKRQTILDLRDDLLGEPEKPHRQPKMKVKYGGGFCKNCGEEL
jgi:hypothetical protein